MDRSSGRHNGNGFIINSGHASRQGFRLYVRSSFLRWLCSAVCQLQVEQKRDTAIILNLPSLLGLFLLMIQTADTAKLDIIPDFSEKCTITYYIIIALMPLIYNIVKLLRCRAKVDAKCINVEAVKLRRYSNKEYYRIYWSYSYNEKGYVHKDILSFWESSEGDKIRLRINPKDPHDIHRVKLPGFCMLMMLFCCALAVFAFSTASGNPVY